jgi:hypothetical protein
MSGGAVASVVAQGHGRPRAAGCWDEGLRDGFRRPSFSVSNAFVFGFERLRYKVSVAAVGGGSAGGR